LRRAGLYEKHKWVKKVRIRIMIMKYGTLYIKPGNATNCQKQRLKPKKWSAMRILFEYQHDLGLEVSSFNIIAMLAATFLQLAQEYDNQGQLSE
jgi:hypothetical protein